MLEIALLTGMRQGELRAFRCEWIDWRRGFIEVPADREFAPKSRKPRKIPLFARLERALRHCLGDRREGPVFIPRQTTRSGRGKTRGIYIRGIILRAKKKSKVPILGSHDLRHYYGSWLLDQGLSIVEVQEILGHADVNTTRRYLHTRKDFVTRVRGQLEDTDPEWATAPSGGIGPEKDSPREHQTSRERGEERCRNRRESDRNHGGRVAPQIRQE